MRRIETMKRLKISLKESELIKQILSHVVFYLVVLLLGIGVDFGHEIHLASEYDVAPHYLFYDPPLYRLFNALCFQVTQFLVFCRA